MQLWVNWKLFLIHYLIFQGLNLDIMNYNIHNFSCSCFISNEQWTGSYMVRTSVLK